MLTNIDNNWWEWFNVFQNNEPAVASLRYVLPVCCQWSSRTKQGWFKTWWKWRKRQRIHYVHVHKVYKLCTGCLFVCFVFCLLFFFLVLMDHGVYMYNVYIWKWSSAHALGASVVWYHSLLLMNSFNKTEVAVFLLQAMLPVGFPFHHFSLTMMMLYHDGQSTDQQSLVH